MAKGWSSIELRYIQHVFDDRMYIFRQGFRKEKDALLFNAKGLVYPSLFEGFGLVLLEAAQYTCPVLTAESTVCQEVLAYYTNQEGSDLLILTRLKVLDKD